MLGDFGAPLEWSLTRFGACSHPICGDDDLERETSGGRSGDHHLSDRSQAGQGSYADGGNPSPAMADLGKMVC
jgi:hypothetical protein